MPLTFKCPSCSATLKMPDESAGRVVRCGGCQKTCRVPDAAPAAVDTRPAPPETTPRPVAPRPARTRPAEPPRRRRGLVWLVGGIVVVVLLATGGLLAYLAQPRWRAYEPAGGGFRVEMPASPRAAGAPTGAGGPGQEVTGGQARLLFREEYFVAGTNIQRHVHGNWRSDEVVLNDGVSGALAGVPGSTMVSEHPIEVNGAPGREVVITHPEKGSAVMRVVVASNRTFVLVATGASASPDNPRVRRFLDSLEITDAAILAQFETQKQNKLRAAEAQRLAVEKAQADLRAFETAAYTGPPVPDPTTLKGLVAYLPFDAPDPTVEKVSGKSVVKWVGEAKPGPGVRGGGGYATTKGATVDASAAVASVRFGPATPFTVAGWFKCRSGGGYLMAGFNPADPKTNLELLLGWGDVIANVRGPAVYDLSHTWYTHQAKSNRAKTGSEDDKWHHYAIVRRLKTTGETMTLYVNGNTAGTRELNVATDLTSLSEWRFSGPFPSNAGLHVDCVGAADEVCAFNRALTEPEVRFLAGREPLPPGGFTSDATEWRPPPPATYRLTPGPNLGPVAAAAFDPTRKAVWVVVADPKADGDVLKRYSYPELTPEKTYRLPGRATHAALDPKTNRLFVGADDPTAKPPAKQVVIAGFVRGSATVSQYELSALPAVSGGEPPTLKPAHTFQVTGPLNGLIAAPGGEGVFAVLLMKKTGSTETIAMVTATTGNGPPKAHKSLVTGKPSRMSFTPAGDAVWVLGYGPGSMTPTLNSFRFADGQTEGQASYYNLGEKIEQWTVAPDRGLYTVRADGSMWLTVSQGGGGTINRQLRGSGVRFLELVPDRVLLLTSGDDRVSVYRTDLNRDTKGDWPPSGELTATKEGPVGGPFWAGADGTVLLFASGQVVRVEETAPAK